MPHIASTLTGSQIYTSYHQGPNDLQEIERQVLIHGGSGIANKMMITPKGAILTPVTDDELELLETNTVFRLHLDNGFVRILRKSVDGEKASADMSIGDKSSPLNPAMFAEKNSEKPETLSVNSGAVA